jgi:hypothetical protein
LSLFAVLVVCDLRCFWMWIKKEKVGERSW